MNVSNVENPLFHTEMIYMHAGFQYTFVPGGFMEIWQKHWHVWSIRMTYHHIIPMTSRETQTWWGPQKVWAAVSCLLSLAPCQRRLLLRANAPGPWRTWKWNAETFHKCACMIVKYIYIYYVYIYIYEDIWYIQYTIVLLYTLYLYIVWVLCSLLRYKLRPSPESPKAGSARKSISEMCSLPASHLKPWPSRNSGFTYWKWWFSIVM